MSSDVVVHVMHLFIGVSIDGLCEHYNSGN